MSSSEETKKTLKKLMDRLSTKAEVGYGRLSFQAKALGKSDGNIHLAVETGIISVPIKEIEAISPIPGRSDVEVMVDVRNGESIRHLRRVPDSLHYPIPPGTIPENGPFVWPPRVPPGGFPNVGADGGASSTTGECSGIDTTCASGGVADQTDDYRQSCWHDTD
jgi:hypothetical protein